MDIIKHAILTTKSAVYPLKNHVFDYVGNSMVEQLGCWTSNPEVLSLSPMLADS